jgi:hypothetical protein
MDTTSTPRGSTVESTSDSVVSMGEVDAVPSRFAPAVVPENAEHVDDTDGGGPDSNYDQAQYVLPAGVSLDDALAWYDDNMAPESDFGDLTWLETVSTPGFTADDWYWCAPEPGFTIDIQVDESDGSYTDAPEGRVVVLIGHGPDTIDSLCG